MTTDYPSPPRPHPHTAPSEETSSIGRRIRWARKAQDLNQEALAHRLGVTQPTVANWEADVHNPRQLMLAKLAEALDVSLGWLAGGETFEPRGAAYASSSYLSRALFHVPVIPSRLLTTRELFEEGQLHKHAVDFISISARKGELFAAFVEAAPYTQNFPGESLFIFDHRRRTPTAGSYALITAPDRPFLHYWPEGTEEDAESPRGGLILGTMVIAVRFL